MSLTPALRRKRQVYFCEFKLADLYSEFQDIQGDTERACLEGRGGERRERGGTTDSPQNSLSIPYYFSINAILKHVPKEIYINMP